MRLSKICAAVTSVLLTMGVMALFPSQPECTSAEINVVSDTFDVNYDGWYSTSDYSALTPSSDIAYSGLRSMHITDRISAEDGASSNKGFYLAGGVDYNYSLYVYHNQDNPENFVLSISYLCADGITYETQQISSKTVKSGEWTEINTNFTAPDGAVDISVKLTTDSTADFYFDAFNVTANAKEHNYVVEAASNNLGLKDEFANYFRVGNILNGGTVKNSAITANIIKDYNSIECENETKPDATLNQAQCSGTNIAVKLDSAAAIFDFCIKNNIGVRGHTLVWHSQTPQWFFKDNFQDGGNWVSSSVMDQRMESYIKNMFAAIKTQYPQLNLYAYDVANECVSDDSNRTANNGGAREPGYGNGKSPWVQVYGNNSFVEKAFTYARKYAPEGCDLYYNDYNEYWDHKRDCIYNMCKSLYEKGLLDGVGMQSHVPANATGFAGTDSYITAMKKYLSIGCDVQVTELDISVENGKYSYDDQAAKYKAIFQAAMDWNKNPKSDGRVTLVAIWGPNDANSWLSAGSNGLLYDSNNQPKAAYNTLISMLPASEWGDGSNPSGGEVKPIEPNEYGWYFSCPFEGDTCSWEGRGAATVMTSGRTAYVGNEALLVQDRTAAWNGASMSLNRAFKAGEEYSFSVNVNYFDGPETDDFYLKLQYTDASGETQYSSIAEGKGVKGQWVQLANKNYKIPDGATNLQIYVETAETTNNFYIDEAIGAVAGTTIIGAGEAKQIIRGDVDFSGTIDALDVSAIKHGYMKGFDASAEKAADVDQSGVVDAEDIKLLKEYVLGKIDKFPVAEKVVDTAAMESLFAAIKPSLSYKKLGENNVCWTQRFGADPGFMVYKDRLYVFTTNDAVEYKADGSIQPNTYNSGTINCFSTADLVNWTDHGPLPIAGKNGRTTNGVCAWASYAWAPDAAWKTINGKDKFFLYFADSAGGIGVVTADSPEGPYTDPLGHALINKGTNGYGDVEWLFDPAVLVDDDGTGYLYCGGGVPSGKAADPGTARAVKLGADMISLDGSPARINPPYLFEDSSILKVGNTYYYSYCTNWSTGGNPYGFGNAQIGVMTSTSPLGPFTYKGIAFKNPAEYSLDGGGNNHHSIVEFKGKYYMLYHSRNQSRAMDIKAYDSNGNLDLGGNYRSCHIDSCNFSNGMFSATGTMKGVEPVGTLNPYEKVRASTIYRQGGLNTRGVGDTIVTDIQKGDWFGVKNVEFSKGASQVTMKVSSSKGGAIKVCTGSESGTAVGYIEVPATGGSFQEVTGTVSGLSGTKDIYFVFSDEMEVDSWSFK